MKNKGYFTGFSETGIDDAIQNALLEAGEFSKCEIVETFGVQDHLDQKQYHATLLTYID